MKRAAVVLLCAALAGCFAPSAARRSGRIIADGWDVDRHGGYAAFTGPTMSLLAIPDFVVHALVPLHYDEVGNCQQ